MNPDGAGIDPRMAQQLPPGVNLARDPNMPSKSEQVRAAAFQLTMQLAASGSLAGDGFEDVQDFIGATRLVEKYLDRG